MVPGCSLSPGLNLARRFHPVGSGTIDHQKGAPSAFGTPFGQAGSLPHIDHPINLRGGVGGAEAVVDVHHGYSGAAGVQHAEQGG